MPYCLILTWLTLETRTCFLEEPILLYQVWLDHVKEYFGVYIFFSRRFLPELTCPLIALFLDSKNLAFFVKGIVVFYISDSFKLSFCQMRSFSIERAIHILLLRMLLFYLNWNKLYQKHWFNPGTLIFFLFSVFWLISVMIYLSFKQPCSWLLFLPFQSFLYSFKLSYAILTVLRKTMKKSDGF